MKDYQRQFLNFTIEHGALRFGEFTLKSGRKSPYFFNAGLFNTGSALKHLGEYYAAAIRDWNIGFDVLFGPAYKGIPLVCATAIALAGENGRDMPYCFNRKESKDHAEGGVIVGAKLSGRVMIIDDVMSAGLSVGEAVSIIRDSKAEPAGVLIALDRQERGHADDRSAVAMVQSRLNIPVRSIATLADVITLLSERDDLRQWVESIRAYRSLYGA